MTGQAFVDESKRRDYLLVASGGTTRARRWVLRESYRHPPWNDGDRRQAGIPALRYEYDRAHTDQLLVISDATA